MERNRICEVVGRRPCHDGRTGNRTCIGASVGDTGLKYSQDEAEPMPLFRNFSLDQARQIGKLLVDLSPHLSSDKWLEQTPETLHRKLTRPMQACTATLWLKIPSAKPARTRHTANDKASIGFEFRQLGKDLRFPPSQVTQLSKLRSCLPGTRRECFHLERALVELALIL